MTENIQIIYNNLVKLSEAMSARAEAGNGDCHRFYVSLQKTLALFNNVAPPYINIDGYDIDTEIIKNVINSNGNYISYIKELRARYSMTLQAAKAIVDRILENPKKYIGE